MADTTIGISFSESSQVADRDCLKLEQEPWGKDVGETTKMQGILGIAAAVNGTRWPEVRCGGLNGIFTATVYGYPCRQDMVFQFKVSHGEVVSSKAETAYREEVIQCSLRDTVTPDYPVQRVGTLAWIGHCYDEQGNITSRPQVTVDEDGTVLLSKKVYGSLRFRYTVYRYEYKVEVSRRLHALENKYEAVAYAVWNGGVTWIDIEAPANFEAFDGDCGNGAFYGDNLQDGYTDGQLSQSDICAHKYHTFPTAVSADRNIKVDYCSQEVISDSVVSRVEDEETRDTGDCNG